MLSRHAVEFLVEPDGLGGRAKGCVRLEQDIVGSLDLIYDRLILSTKLLSRDLFSDFERLQVETYAIELRQRLIHLADDDGCGLPGRTDRRSRIGDRAEIRIGTQGPLLKPEIERGQKLPAHNVQLELGEAPGSGSRYSVFELSYFETRLPYLPVVAQRERDCLFQSKNLHSSRIRLLRVRRDRRCYQ